MNDSYAINCHNDTEGTKRSCHGLTLCLGRQKFVTLTGSFIVTEFRLGPSVSSEGTKWQRSASKGGKKNYLKERKSELITGHKRERCFRK